MAATREVDRFRDPPGREAGILRAVFLPEPRLAVAFETGVWAAALGAGVRLAAAFLVRFAGGVLDPASTRAAPDADRSPDASAVLPPVLESTASGTAGDSSGLRAMP